MRKRNFLRWILVSTWLVGSSLGCASGSGSDWSQLLEGSGVMAMRPLDHPTIVSGLKEALRVGTQNAVRSTSRTDGFLANELIRIVLPEPLQKTGNALRTVGFGAQVDELETTMNRAAERASGEAIDVFVEAITQMTFADAKGILEGGEHAATEYFKQATSESLRVRFQPIVEDKMGEVGLIREYNALVAQATAFPFVPKPKMSLEGYVTEKTLEGLFTVLAQEESRIRTDPSARVTELLRRVFR